MRTFILADLCCIAKADRCALPRRPNPRGASDLMFLGATGGLRSATAVMGVVRAWKHRIALYKPSAESVTRARWSRLPQQAPAKF